MAERSLEDLRIAAERGDPVAQSEYGLRFLEGNGVAKDYSQALRWLHAAAGVGEASALNRIGCCYQQGFGVPQDLTEAVKWYRKGAEKGDAKAQVNLGVCFEYGTGVEKNLKEAFRLYQLSAAQGLGEGQYRLGRCLDEEIGVKENLTEALKWYQSAAAQGHIDAQCALAFLYQNGRGVPKDLAEAAKWFRLAAEQGNDWAQQRLGNAYKYGLGVPQDLVEAAKWFRASAEQGNDVAQLSLSHLLEKGDRVPKDENESLKWLIEAANNENPRAQARLGFEYLQGKRIDRDEKRAEELLRKSAEEANELDGQEFYSWALLTGKLGPNRDSEAVHWLKRAAEQGSEFGQTNLGKCYANGRGTTVDFAEARKWLKAAAKQGDSEANFQLRHLWFKQRPILKWRFAVASVLGSAFLVYHAITVPIHINGWAIAAFIAIAVCSATLFVGVMALLERTSVYREDPKEGGFVSRGMAETFTKKPWRLLLIPAEDGFFLLPLLYIGITPVSAAVAAILFAVMHYPHYPWRHCLPKGVAYFFVALFILPAGIWSVVIGHLLLDAFVFLAAILITGQGKAISRRFLRVMKVGEPF